MIALATNARIRDGFRVRSITTPHWVKLAGATALALVLSYIVAKPLYLPWQIDYSNESLIYTRYPAMARQLADPVGWDKAIRLHAISPHHSIKWRLLPPVVGNHFGMGPMAYFSTATAGLVWLVLLAIHYSRTRTFIGMLSVGTLVTTSWAYLWTLHQVFYFDPFYLVALLVVAFSPSRCAIAGACLLGPWVDEKFLFALPICMALRWTREPDRKWVWTVVACTLPYVGARIAAHLIGDGSIERQIAIQSTSMDKYAALILPGYLLTFKFGWWAVGSEFWNTIKGMRQRALQLAFGVVSVAIVAVLAFLAWDTTRTMAIMLPFIVAYAARSEKSLWVMAALNVVTPFACAYWDAVIRVGLWA